MPLIITVFILIASSYLQVTYQTDSFLEKNRDYIVAEHCNLLSSSRCPFVSGLFTSLPEESIRSSYKFSSVASRFKVSIKRPLPFFYSFEYLYLFHSQIVHTTKTLIIAVLIIFLNSYDSYVTLLLSLKLQLQALMETLNSTEPHYVRCVKPNSANRPQLFENQSVLHQLRCGVRTFTEAWNTKAVLQFFSLF